MGQLVRLILWFISLLMLGLSVGMVVDFNGTARQLGLIDLTAHGVNTVTADVGGVIFAIGMLLLLYLLNGRRWLWPCFIIVAGLTILRYMSMIVDGWVETAIPALGLEVITLVALLLMAFVYDRNESPGGELFDGLNARTMRFLTNWVAIILIIDGLAHIVTLVFMPRETGDPSGFVPAMGFGVAYVVLGAWLFLRKSLVAAGIIMVLQTCGFLALTMVINSSMVPLAVDRFLLFVAITNVTILFILFFHRSQWRSALADGS